MALPNALKNFNTYLDGESYLGIVEEVKLPKLGRKMEKFRGGGMDGEVDIDVGQEALEMEIDCGGHAHGALKQYGATKANAALVRFAGAYQRDDTGVVQAVEVVARGRLKEFDPGSAKSGDKGKTSLKFTLTYYKLIIDGKDAIEIDLLAFIFKVDGVDMLEAQRKAIGLA